jgi:hypothetical protein
VPALAALNPPPRVRLVALPTRRRTRVAFRRGSARHPAIAAALAALRVAARPYTLSPVDAP